MKINSFKILYSTTIPIQSYGVNDKIAVEMEFMPEKEELFDVEQELADLKKDVDAIVAKLYPNRYVYDAEKLPITTADEYPQYKTSQSSTHEETRIGDIVNDIKSCKDLTVLSSYKLIAKTKPEFQEAYDEMFNKLSNQNTTTK